MITKIHLQKDAVILSANGERLGSLERVVLHPDENVVTDLVVRIGNFLQHEEKVVPIEYVAETNEGLILLQDTAGDLKSFPPFEEEHVVESNIDTPSSSEGVPSVVMGYPVAGSPVMPIMTDHVVTRIEQNIPSGTVAMKAGATVLDTDGKHVGHVERVLAEPIKDQIKQMLISSSSGLLTREIKLIPIKWVMKVDEDTVRLRVDKTTVENLVEEPVVG
jgi:sporulation protein YlmC with PRC-barrel domain